MPPSKRILQDTASKEATDRTVFFKPEVCARLFGLVSAERCPSGLRSTLGKRVSGKPDRGFESHPLRHIYLIQYSSTIPIRATQCYIFRGNCRALHTLAARKRMAIQTVYYRQKIAGTG